jgi:hypothetical protein
MLQVFHDDVAKVELDVAMFHMCLARVASVLSECWIFHRDISSPSAGRPPWPRPQSDARHPSSSAGHHFPTLAAKNVPPPIFYFLCCKCCISVL